MALEERGKRGVEETDFGRAPYLVIWETTRACALKCVHCRAEAMDHRSPGELSTEQALELLEEIRRFGSPLVVLTGGDPMRRDDIYDLVEYGTWLGLTLSLTPSATPEMTREKVFRLKACGLKRLAVSLDGSSPEIHDAFRGTPGSYGWTLDIVRWAREAGLPVQINTTVTRYNVSDMPRIAEGIENWGMVLWSVFLLVPVGRGRAQDLIPAEEVERLFRWLAELSGTASFDIKSTEAPHYRRVLLQTQGARPAARSLCGIGRARRGVNDGKGFVFVSHTGEIFPSGFLPVSAGNVKADSLVRVYRNAPLFLELRDASLLKGKCGACEFKNLCGGSRARAFAVHGDYLASDPFCAYVPLKVRP